MQHPPKMLLFIPYYSVFYAWESNAQWRKNFHEVEVFTNYFIIILVLIMVLLEDNSGLLKK